MLPVDTGIHLVQDICLDNADILVSLTNYPSASITLGWRVIWQLKKGKVQCLSHIASVLWFLPCILEDFSK